jgi:hypothetical protein
LGDFADCLWRVGRKLGRTIYAVLGEGEREDGTEGNCDVLLGMMETRELAERIVSEHNAVLGMDSYLEDRTEEAGWQDRG